MARISRNSFQRGKNRSKVIQQFGVPVVDADFNEAQDILQVMAAEAAMASMTTLRATLSGAVRTGIASGTDWQPYATGTAAIFITKGTIYVDGYQLTLDADVDVSANGVAFPAPVTDVYGLLFVDIVLAEKDSSADASIAIPNVGETSLRQVLSTTWTKTESPTSFEAAFTAAAALPVVGAATIWKGNTARVFLARYRRLNGVATVAAAAVFDMRGSIPAERNYRTPLLKFHKAADNLPDEANGHRDGYALWDATTGSLQIGNRANATTDADKLLGAVVLRTPGAPNHRIALDSAQEWTKLGAATANGTPLTFDGTQGLIIADGSGVGYFPAIPTNLSAPFANKVGAFTDVYSVVPVPATQNVAAGVSLSVQTMATFAANQGPGTFMLCYRQGLDLIWWNGHVTKGNLNQPVLDDPTGAIPPNYQLVVGKNGSVHGSGSWALETGLDYLASGFGAGALGLGRVVKALAQRGSWDFARAVRKYGTIIEGGAIPTYHVDNQLFQIEGDGPGLTKIIFNPAETSSRVVTDLAEGVVTAHKIVLRGITFASAEDATHARGYLLSLKAFEVVLENCHFFGGVQIDSPRITIRGCYFAGVGSAVSHWAATNTNFTAQHLNIVAPTGATTTSIKTLIEDCRFDVSNDLGTHSSVVIYPADRSIIVIRNSDWAYVSGLAQASAISIRSVFGNVSIDDCAFRDASGIAKAGTAGAVDFSITNDYNGSLLTLKVGVLYDAAAYISCVVGRARSGTTNVRRCRFHLGNIGNGNTGSRYILWAAMACVINSKTAAASVEMANILFAENRIQLGMDNGLGVGWDTTNAALNQPVTYGFVLGPEYVDPLSITNYVAQDIEVANNFFDIGGEGLVKNAYRGIFGPSWAWPATGNWVTITSAPIVIFNGSGRATAVGIVLTGRTTHAIKVDGNRILQQFTSTNTLQTNLVTTSQISYANGAPQTINDIYVMEGIIVVKGFPATLDSTNNAALYAAPNNQLFNATISNNVIVSRIIAPFVTAIAVFGFNFGIHIHGTFMKVLSNYVHFAPSGNSTGVNAGIYDVFSAPKSVFVGNVCSGSYGILNNNSLGATTPQAADNDFADWPEAHFLS